MKLLLDTCTFLWIVADAPALPPAAREAFMAPDHEVFLSAVSAWEITVEHGLGRLPPPAPPSQLVVAERGRHGIVPLPLEETAALSPHRVPDLHRDPFDRMLICQAIEHGCALLTPDPAIRQYPVKTLW